MRMSLYTEEILEVKCRSSMLGRNPLCGNRVTLQQEQKHTASFIVACMKDQVSFLGSQQLNEK
jgi:hypothetical protein